MKKYLLVAACLASTFSSASNAADYTRHERWKLDSSYYDIAGNYKNEFLGKYVEKQYCLEAAQQYWQKFWSGRLPYIKQVYEVLCASNKSYDAVHVVCDKNNSCAYRGTV